VFRLGHKHAPKCSGAHPVRRLTWVLCVLWLLALADMLMGAILPTSGPNGTKVDNRTLTVAALMTSMANQFRTNTSSSIADFWNTSQVRQA
jgi:hypothetical protein